MKNIRLKIIPKPLENTASVITRGDSPNKDPFFIGTGSYKLACGFCGFIIANGVEFKQFKDIVFHCPKCNKYNTSNNTIEE